jgi:pimeloyl-ACP methyl ester carboxylesterase
MKVIEYGSGEPLVLVPGSQGRWEYLRPAIDALSRFFRVLTFPLCGEPGSHCRLDPARGLDNYTAQVSSLLDSKQVADATICGVSFGGLIALRFAACHPNRTTTLVLVSTPAPTWQLRKRHRLYVRAPWVFGPVFVAESHWRLRAELAAALPDRRQRWTFRRSMLQIFAEAPLSLARMAARARLIDGIDMRGDCAAVAAPTLIITGEHPLDSVVPARGSSAYAQLIPNARAVVLERTGHLGSITRPDAFAALVYEFVRQMRSREWETEAETVETETEGNRGNGNGGKQRKRYNTEEQRNGDEQRHKQVL